jgi:hypothetical protein
MVNHEMLGGQNPAIQVCTNCAPGFLVRLRRVKVFTYSRRSLPLGSATGQGTHRLYAQQWPSGYTSRQENRQRRQDRADLHPPHSNRDHDNHGPAALPSPRLEARRGDSDYEDLAGHPRSTVRHLR